jgi:RNA methyltransferase, TrmH family
MKGARTGDHHRGRPPRRLAELHERKLLQVCGLAAVAALFTCDAARVERLFFEPRLREAARLFCTVLASAHKPYREVAPAELVRIAGTVLHGGIAAIARPRPPAPFDAASAADWARDGKPLIVLDGIGNPHNLGAIVRTAAFFGLRHIVLADRAEQALPSDASYRIAEGGFEHLSLYRAALPRALPGLARHYHIIGAAAEGGAVPLRPRDGRPPAIVLGNEESGLDSATLELCDEVARIPGSGKVQSLNVAAAAAILIYALSR